MKYLMFTLTLVAGFASPLFAQDLSPEQKEQLKRDKIHMAVQEICPVSGQELGAHGKPLKVKIGKEVVFLCCQGCLKGKVDPAHWKTIHANFAKAQRICPVMKHELPDNPKWTIAEGQIVYVCCPAPRRSRQSQPHFSSRLTNSIWPHFSREKVVYD